MRPEWFAPKRHGFGAGLPIARQGWAVPAAFGPLTGPARLPPAMPRLPAGVAPAAAPVAVAWFTTSGGWRRRP